jgi:hypothetical protein
MPTLAEIMGQTETPRPKLQGLLGYEMRSAYPTENAFFKNNPHVGGMASEDGKVVLNSFSPLNPQERESVARNEALRLFMRDKNFAPTFGLTPEQQMQFQGTAYGDGNMDARHTILARMLSGDPSAKTPSFEQDTAKNRLLQLLMLNGHR